MCITEQYRKLNQNLHINRPGYGTGGAFWAGLIWTFALRLKAKTCLDYGAGKRTLEKSGLNRHMEIRSYDPCIPEISRKPEKCDIVICSDVLEHIEPSHLTDVIEDLDKLSKLGLFLSITTIPGDKILEDGRNNHLIVQPKSDWLKLFPRNWNITILGEDEEKFWCEVIK